MVRELEAEWPTLKDKLAGTRFGIIAEELVNNIFRRRR
jgi:hypothetical protein